MAPKSTRVAPTMPRKHQPQRGNPRLAEHEHDPYHSDIKVRTPVRCAECGAVYRAGRWTWERTNAATPNDFRCPACRRIRDHYPAGELTLGGAFLKEPEDEARRMMQHIEAHEKAEHPLHRIMALQRDGDHLVVTTTDIHLPRQIGHALENAWGGQLSTHYDEDGYFVRVTWERDA